MELPEDVTALLRTLHEQKTQAEAAVAEHHRQVEESYERLYQMFRTTLLRLCSELNEASTSSETAGGWPFEKLRLEEEGNRNLKVHIEGRYGFVISFCVKDPEQVYLVVHTSNGKTRGVTLEGNELCEAFVRKHVLAQVQYQALQLLPGV
jgi:hypothetical protein